MNIKKAKDIIYKILNDILDNQNEITDETPLIGSSALLDSMKLVELCLALEEISEENNFEFDWTSESTMSNSKSIFRNVSSLANEFVIQSEKK